MTDEWPLRSFLEVQVSKTAPGRVRHHARQVMQEWGLGDLADTCVLALSELVTNSVEAAAGLDRPTTVRCWLYSDKQKVLLLVWDALPEPPVPVDLAAEGFEGMAESGRGLFLVYQLSEQWSWERLAGGGKVVWALISEPML